MFDNVPAIKDSIFYIVTNNYDYAILPLQRNTQKDEWTQVQNKNKKNKPETPFQTPNTSSKDAPTRSTPNKNAYGLLSFT